MARDVTDALHPLSWLGICLSLAYVVTSSSNWAVTLVVLCCVVSLSVARAGERRSAALWALVVGGVAFLVHLVLGALAGPIPADPTVIRFLPEWAPGESVSVGGPVTVEQLSVALERGLDAWVLCALVGLLWQACPAEQWCDLARTFFGRGSQLLVPALCLGESVAVVRSRGHRRGRIGAVVEANRELGELWRMHARPSRPVAGRAVVAAFLLMLVTGVLFVIAMIGGLQVRLDADRVITVSARTLLLVVVVVWMLTRLTFAGQRLTRPLGWPDGLALLGVVAVVGGTVATDVAGNTEILTGTPGEWPRLPVLLVAGVAISLVTWMALLGATAREER